MLRFFRNIRKKMIEEDNVRKYLPYAIGEILLVVIGILVALQVNNWNEERKEQNLAENILVQLHEKVAQDTLGLNRQADRYQRMINETEWVIEQFENDAPYVSRMDTALAMISAFSILEADYTAFNYLENVGIGIIQDQTLRDAISNYYAYSKFIDEVDEYFELNKYFRQEIYPKYFRRYRYSSFVIPVDYEALKKSSEFRIVVDMCFNDSIYYNRMTLQQIERAEELLSMIKTELGT